MSAFDDGARQAGGLRRMTAPRPVKVMAVTGGKPHTMSLAYHWALSRTC